MLEWVTRNVEAIHLQGVAAVEATDERAAGPASQPLADLYAVLIQPIADLLPAAADARVIFIPQGGLSRVPFVALQDATGTELVERYAIATAPSIQTLAFAQAQKQRLQADRSSASTFALSSQSPVLIVGHSTRSTVPLTFGEPLQLSSGVEAANREVTAIAQLFNDTAITSNETSQSSLLFKLSQAQLIHFATPIIVNAQLSGRSTSVFLTSGILTSGSDDNISLTATDILKLPLKADLVVLSGSHPHPGKTIEDDGVDLPHAFIAAGVPSVVISLWPAPEAPKRLLMTSFYQQLQHSSNKAQALRQAMLTTREQYPNPRDWAGFILVGEIE